ncbi:hypothetical protein BDF22DRAFT_443240 [Syncephalis plumigaleata]|nr:hypothetical protein BDF22DRAFT_443240 [Syncephalis plumigaleata]
MENTSESTITRRNSSNKRARSPEVSQSTWTIVGYEAKLFRRAALDLNEFLQSWRDHGVLLDRYDVRNLLDEQQLDAVRYTEKLGELTDSVKFAEEQELDSMRYHDLDSDEEVLFDMDAQEREQHVEEKRKRNKLADEGREFYYDYGDSNTNTHHDNEHIESDRMEQQRSSSADMISTRMNDHERAASITNAPLVTKPKVDAFTPTFSIPEDMIIPETKRLAEIIERTARYLNASTDPQLEILIKAKQAHNRDFAFLDTRHYLHEYYKHVRWIMASGLGDYASSNDDDDDDEHQSTCSSHYSDTEIEIPSDQELKQFIDRMAEFIARNGDDYEEQIRTNHSNPADCHLWTRHPAIETIIDRK